MAVLSRYRLVVTTVRCDLLVLLGMQWRAWIIALFLFPVAGIGQGIFHYYTGLILPDKNDPERMDRWVFDITYNNWLTLPDGIKVKPYSIGWNVARYYDFPINKSAFGVAFGYGYSMHNVHHNGEFIDVVDPTSGDTYTSLVPLDPNYKYWRNKIVFNYVEAPFELRIRTKKRRKKARDESGNKVETGEVGGQFRFYPGFKVGWLFNVHTTVRDTEGKYKEYNFHNANRLRYGATLRIGYGRINIFGFYSLTNAFKDGQGDELQPFSVGLSILTF